MGGEYQCREIPVKFSTLAKNVRKMKFYLLINFQCDYQVQVLVSRLLELYCRTGV